MSSTQFPGQNAVDRLKITSDVINTMYLRATHVALESGAVHGPQVCSLQHKWGGHLLLESKVMSDVYQGVRIKQRVIQIVTFQVVDAGLEVCGDLERQGESHNSVVTLNAVLKRDLAES